MTTNYIPDMPSEDYHAHPAFSKSQLDKINKSPAHYVHSLHEDKKTDQMRFGTILHTFVLEPDTIGDRYAIQPEGIDRRTKEGKAAWQAFQDASVGREVITLSDRDKAWAMMDAIYKHPVAGNILRADNRLIEGSYFWRDEQTGLDLRCRPDLYLPSLDVIVDLKTTACAKPSDFSRSAWNYRYHVQAAMYSDGVTAVTKQPISSFVFIAVETEAPYPVCVFYASDEMISRGRWEMEQNLITAAECVRNQTWPGYSDDLLELNLPGWVK